MAALMAPVNGAWRVTTAARVFTLALATGRAVSSGGLDDAVVALAVLGILAALASVLELYAPEPLLRWLPSLEAALLTAFLLTTRSPVDPLLMYLAVPPLVSAVRHGWVMATNTCLTSVVALTIVVASPMAPTTATARSAVFWLAVGLGIGLLAGWQTRALRALERRQDPHAEAHRLVSQLHRLATKGQVGLDRGVLAEDLAVAVRAATGASAAAVVGSSPRGASAVLASYGDVTDLPVDVDVLPDRAPADVAVVRLHSGGDVQGTLVARRPRGWSTEARDRLQQVADDFALQLDTAALFDDVRDLATTEERARIAREMHDGVAQEIVGLGYVVDEIACTTEEEPTRHLAESLRSEITRIVTEVRYSIFDLRHTVSDHRLSVALTDYVHQLGQGTDIEVHVSLEESGPPLAPRVESELLRIAQEALGNVRKHARADNVWLTFVSDGTSVRLEIADDGVGNARPRDQHWGLQTMQERAAGIGAALTITSGADSGTVVSLQSPATVVAEGTVPREHDRTPHR